MKTPRRRVSVDIKLLRLELVVKGASPFDGIGYEWSHAQPTESLSPQSAAQSLNVEEWAPSSVVKSRYKKLQLRYPPEQFTQKHLELRPSAELLGDSANRLNWYWQSGLIPEFYSELVAQENSLWDRESVEPAMDSKIYLSTI